MEIKVSDELLKKLKKYPILGNSDNQRVDVALRMFLLIQGFLKEDLLKKKK